MHGFGISLLRFGERPQHGIDEDGEVRRAFCWLLTSTRQWFEEQASAVAGNQPPLENIRSLTLRNWRVPGERTLTFDLPVDSANQARTGIHIVHGGNGAGKSSLVEALEFALLGDLERLAGFDLAEIVEHRAPAASRVNKTEGVTARQQASIVLSTQAEGSSDQQVRTIDIRAEKKKSSLQFRAGAFRLDQMAMDRLTNSDDRGRASYFLSSFFPAEHAAIKALEEARASAEVAWKDLPDNLARQLSGGTERPAELPPSSDLSKALAWVAGPLFDCRTGSEGAELCLPVPLDELIVLTRIEPDLADPVRRLASGPLSEEAFAETLRELEKPLRALTRRIADIAIDIGIAHDALGRKAFDDWLPVSRRTTGDPVASLNRWLHALAFKDLVRRQREILEALELAGRNGWRFPGTDNAGGLVAIAGAGSRSPTLIGDLREQEARWSRQVAEYEQQLPTAGPAGNPTADSMPVPMLTDAECDALDKVGDWLPHGEAGEIGPGGPAEPEQPLGQAITEALRLGERRRCGTFAIGEPAWAEAIRKELGILAASSSNLSRQSGRGSPADALKKLRALHKAVEELSLAQETMERSFLNRVLPEKGDAGGKTPLLSHALDELLTLFTPARWGYATLGLKRRSGERGAQSLSLSQEGEDGAHLRLNTAELNLFTVALFLLCAPGTNNPFRLLVFDDPLQNMDEQTVTVLARGIGKVVRLLPEGWQLLFFFHGEDDLARFRNELPARIYPLPWLMPLGTVTDGNGDIKGSQPPAPCATTHERQSADVVLRMPR